MKYFQRACGGTHPKLFPQQRMRRRVEMALELDVVVDVERNSFPRRDLKRLGGKRAERGFVEPLEQLTPTGLVRTHGARVDDLGELRQASIELSETRERLVADAREQPALGHLNADFDLGFVARRHGS